MGIRPCRAEAGANAQPMHGRMTKSCFGTANLYLPERLILKPDHDQCQRLLKWKDVMAFAAKGTGEGESLRASIIDCKITGIRVWKDAQLILRKKSAM